MVEFKKLNEDWNAEPNAPSPEVRIDGADLVLTFLLNAFRFPAFKEGEIGALRFLNCERYRLGGTNDEGWYRGQCRYSKAAPTWGEFYEISGADPLRIAPDDWITVTGKPWPNRHFLFYLRDHTFEAIADNWSFDADAHNALLRLRR